MGFINYSSTAPLRLVLLSCLFLPFTSAAAIAQVREGWHAINGPDGDFTVEFPLSPASETRGCLKSPLQPVMVLCAIVF